MSSLTTLAYISMSLRMLSAHDQRGGRLVRADAAFSPVHVEVYAESAERSG